MSEATTVISVLPIQARQGYMPQLDGLRAFAVLAVLYTHFLPKQYWLLGVYWGGVGVRLFFVLSGFLITRIFLREKALLDNNPGTRITLITNFYIRRYLRLTPVFLATVVMAAILDIPNTRETFWWHAFYVSNVKFALSNSWQGSVAHFWTLSVEEQFYLIWPLVVSFLHYRKLMRLIYLAVPLVLVYRIAARLSGIEDIPIWVLLPDSMDALCLGSLVAVLTKFFGWTSSRRLPCLLAGIGLLLWLSDRILHMPEILQMSEFAKTGLSMSFAWLILRASEGHQGLMGRLLELRPVAYMGKISYGIYVLHLFVFHILNSYRSLFRFAGFLTPVWMAALAIAITITLAALSWHFFEGSSGF